MYQDETYIKASKYGSVKVTGTDATTIEAHVIEIIADAVISALTDDGVPSGTSALTEHGISGVQAEGEIIYAKGKFTSITLSSGSVLVY